MSRAFAAPAGDASPSANSSSRGPDRGWTRALDLGLAATLFVAPLFLGGRGPVGRLVLVACVVATMLIWVARVCRPGARPWRWSGAEWFFGAALALVLVQLVPLPAPVRDRLSPALAELLPLWSGDNASGGTLGEWNRLSFTPRETQGGLVMLLCYGLWFGLWMQRLQTRTDVERLARWLALAAIGMAGLGLAQLFVGNGQFLWIFRHPSRDTFGVAKGAFANQNHFAHFLALGIGPLLWWLHRAGRTTPRVAAKSRFQPLPESTARPWLAIGLGVVIVAALLTASRGGVVALTIAFGAGVALLAGRGLVGRRTWIAAGTLGVVVAIALTIYGQERLVQRMAQFHSLETTFRGRQSLWTSLVRAVPSFLAAGSGVGSHREVYPIYLEEHFATEFTHAENGYLQLVLETGGLGLGLLLVAAGWLAWCGWRSYANSATDSAALTAAFVPGLVASLLHSFGDFVWYIPACAIMTLATAAGLVRLRQLAAESELVVDAPRERVPGWRSYAVAGLAVVLGVVLVRDRVPPALAAPHWYAYERAAFAAQPVLSAHTSAAETPLAAMHAHLTEVLRRDPHDARAHLRQAGLLLRQFDLAQERAANPLPLTQVRDAALASQFPSREALDRWLAVAVGAHRTLLDEALHHARRAVALGPLQGEAYVYLSELAFLAGQPAEAKRPLLDQALRVRPHSGIVLLAAGSDATLAGDYERGMDCWLRAFRLDPEQRLRIIELLTPQLPAESFVTRFEPDADALLQLFERYRQAGQAESSAFVARRWLQQVRESTEPRDRESALARQRQAFALHVFLNEREPALAQARQALERWPDDFALRRLVGLTLAEWERPDEAFVHLQWCQQRRPDDTQVLETLQRVQRERVRTAGHDATALRLE